MQDPICVSPITLLNINKCKIFAEKTGLHQNVFISRTGRGLFMKRGVFNGTSPLVGPDFQCYNIEKRVEVYVP